MRVGRTFVDTAHHREGMMARRAVNLLALVVGLGASAPLAAQVFVVAPNIYTNAEGPGSSSVPIHIQNNPWTFQLIINANQLTGLVGTEISGIAYRHSAVMGGSYPNQPTTWSNYVIRLGPSVAPSAATGTFADNFTAAPTEVHSGAFSVSPGAWPNFGAPGPNPWGPVLEFDTPYLYTGGDLAMLITHSGSDNPNIGDSLIDTTGSASPGRGVDYSYFASTGFGSVTGNSSVFMPIVRFTGFAPVPEFSSGLLSGAALLGLIAIRRKR
jgi:hypothetical protein